MYVCLCKGLSEADVASAAQEAAAFGQADADALYAALGLYCEDACGYCLEHPDTLLRIAHEEWDVLLDETRPRQCA